MEPSVTAEGGRRILVAVDDSDTSERVVEWALEHLLRPGDAVTLLHVIPQPMVEILGGFGAMDAVVTLDPDPAVDAAHVRAAKEMMRRRFVAKLAAADVPCAAEIVHFLTDADSIGEAVCRRAAALRPAAVCMAKHQRGRISEFFLGSATKYVAAHCEAPLVIVHE